MAAGDGAAEGTPGPGPGPGPVSFAFSRRAERRRPLPAGPCAEPGAGGDTESDTDFLTAVEDRELLSGRGLRQVRQRRCRGGGAWGVVMGAGLRHAAGPAPQEGAGDPPDPVPPLEEPGAPPCRHRPRPQHRPRPSNRTHPRIRPRPPHRPRPQHRPPLGGGPGGAGAAPGGPAEPGAAQWRARTPHGHPPAGPGAGAGAGAGPGQGQGQGHGRHRGAADPPGLRGCARGAVRAGHAAGDGLETGPGHRPHLPQGRAPLEQRPRPRGLGLGAEAAPPGTPKPGEPPQGPAVGDSVSIEAGPHRGLRGKVEALDPETGRALVRLQLGGQVVAVSQHGLRPVSTGASGRPPRQDEGGQDGDPPRGGDKRKEPPESDRSAKQPRSAPTGCGGTCGCAAWTGPSGGGCSITARCRSRTCCPPTPACAARTTGAWWRGSARPLWRRWCRGQLRARHGGAGGARGHAGPDPGAGLVPGPGPGAAGPGGPRGAAAALRQHLPLPGGGRRRLRPPDPPKSLGIPNAAAPGNKRVQNQRGSLGPQNPLEAPQNPPKGPQNPLKPPKIPLKAP
ncbi:G-patch domain and KOW motifs-containing protein [Ammospiza nelsoni]|uniref:G-patch domain and KOW motifs-containing protein n=1 Tax=Ammospiza nelsoni TaxID=2857394 RepID=UPI00286CB7DB|nr:G-patch domain and KOW motifs-containing protein [Ammospiza nelsoni]